MIDMQYFQTSEFAKKAGVTVRTLRYYDQAGLLCPTRTESGHRVYSESDFATLQEILTLKFIGLQLSEIKRLLSTDIPEVQVLLAKQKSGIQEQIRRLREVEGTLEKAEETLRTEQVLGVEAFVDIIKAITMSNQFDWFGKFYSDDQKKKLAENAKKWSPEDLKKSQDDWEQLFVDIRAHMDEPLESPEVQKLADRWLELIQGFTNGDPGIQNSLNNAWSHTDEAPTMVREYAAKIKEPSEFIQKALALRAKK